ncbi:MAG: hypothetical protein HY589_01055 [Candidatus Omnitrophica bacterium]|nr:hypothetical protein [Candidatus Omnitrophota bacterium]
MLLEGNYPTSFSLQSEAVLQRKLKSSSSSKDQRFKGNFYTGKVSFYLGHKLDVYGLVGVNEVKLKEVIDETHLVDAKADAFYGVGASYVLHAWEFRRGIMRLGADAKYRHFEPDIDTVKQFRDKIATTKESLSFSEWQVALGLSYQYKWFVPYLGCKYSDMDAHVEFTTGGAERSDKDIASKNIFGVFYGLDLLINDSTSFNIEARHFDENAINAGLNFRF